MDYNQIKEEIKNKISIVDLVSQYTALTPNGKNYKASSPFTNEKTPSFFVNPEKNVYYCFSSSQGGDIFTFLSKIENISFLEAFEKLANKAGIDLDAHKNGKAKKLSTHYSELERIKDIYKNNLNKEIIKKFINRGVTEKTIKEWELGYAKDSWNDICDKSLKDVEIGVCVYKGSKTYNRFRNRLMFPFHDLQGRIIGFSGRSIEDKEKTAKYINISETDLFKKYIYLYGLFFAKPNIRKNNFAILVEGQFDTILSHQAGLPVCVATSGTSVNNAHLQELKKYTNNLIIAFDADEAGRKAILRTIAIALNNSINVKIALIPKGKDPAEVIKESSENWKIIIKNSISFIDYLIKEIKSISKHDVDTITKVRIEIFPMLREIKDEIIKDYSIKKIAEELKINEDLIRDELSIINKPLEIKYKKHSPQALTSIAEIKLSKLVKNFLASITYLKNENIDLKNCIDEANLKKIIEIEKNIKNLSLDISVEEIDGEINKYDFAEETKEKTINKVKDDLIYNLSDVLECLLSKLKIQSILDKDANK